MHYRALIASLVLLSPAQSTAAVQTISLFSPSNGRNVDFVVYTPPGYESSIHRLPVVFDLHGINGNPVNRANLQVVPTLDAAISSGEMMPSIWVFANGQTDSFYGDAHDGHKRVYSHTIDEVLPYVDANFRTVSHRRFRAIEGFSMGGFGAMMLAAKRPDLFSAIVGYSGAYQSWQGLIAPVKAAMYNNVQANFTPYSVYDQIALHASTIANSVKIRMLVGGDDAIQTSNQNLNAYLNQQLAPFGAPSIPLTIVPGIDHNGREMFETSIGIDFLNDHFSSVTPGDADLDDDVDFDDLLTLAQHYGQSGNGSWLDGDFDWNGTIDFDDLLALAQHYGTTSVSIHDSSQFTADWALARSIVPEPLAMLAMFPIIACRRRRCR